MIVTQPGANVVAQARGKLVHFTCLPLGHESSGFVAADVALLPKAVEPGNLGRRPTDSQRKALNGAEVMLLTRSAVTCRRKRRGRGLQRGVIGNSKC